MKKNSCDRAFDQASIDQLSHAIVSSWIDETGIALRPTEKSALKTMIAQSVPAFLETNPGQAMDQFAERIRTEEKAICMTTLENLEESFPGFISKQRLLNAYAYAQTLTSEEPEAVSGD